jgi:hypothetical protein
MILEAPKRPRGHSELDMHPDAFEKSDTRKRSLRLRVYIYISVKLHCQHPPRPRLDKHFKRCLCLPRSGKRLVMGACLSKPSQAAAKATARAASYPSYCCLRLHIKLKADQAATQSWPEPIPADGVLLLRACPCGYPWISLVLFIEPVRGCCLLVAEFIGSA